MKIQIYNQYENETLKYDHLTKIEQQPKDYSPHFHNVCELIFFKSGDMSYMVDGRKYKLRKNMLVLSRPTDRHCLFLDSLADYERYNILFDEKILPFNLYEKIPWRVNVVDLNANKRVIDIFDKMDFYCQNLSGDDLYQMLINLIEEVFYNIIIETSNPINIDYTQTNALVQKAINYIDENLLTLKNLDDICNELYITKSHLHHLFIKHLKITPKKYINSKRLALAKREIVAGSNATDACFKCGFSDYAAFFRAYKKHFGHPPSDDTNGGNLRPEYR